MFIVNSIREFYANITYIFIFFISILILQLTSFYPRKVLIDDYSSLKNLILKNSTIQKCISASLGSILTCTVVTPLDVIKTRLQYQSYNRTFNNYTMLDYLCCYNNNTICYYLNNCKNELKFTGTFVNILIFIYF